MEVKRPMTVTEKIAKERQDLMRKQMTRRVRAGFFNKPQDSVAKLGNPDRGIPYKGGRDRFSGQYRKFNDRIEFNDETEVLSLKTRVTNKF